MEIVTTEEGLNSTYFYHSNIRSWNVLLRQNEEYYYSGDFHMTGTNIGDDKIIFVIVDNTRETPTEG